MFESNTQQQVSMTPESPSNGSLNSSFFACFEDSTFIYQHRKRPRSGESPFDSSPASSTTTTDSMLTNSLNSFSNYSRSSLSRGSCGAAISSGGNSSLSRGSKSLSPPPLTFNLSSTTQYSASPLTSSPKSCKRASRIDCRRLEQKLSRGNDENEPRGCQPLDHHDRTYLKKASSVSALSTNQIKSIQDYTYQQEVDEKVFLNLVSREQRFETSRRQALQGSREPFLKGQLRHSLLSWMLHICEYQQCQDEIFPLATIILDDFLRLNPVSCVQPPQDPKLKDFASHHLQHHRQSLNKNPHCPSSQYFDRDHQSRWHGINFVSESGNDDANDPSRPVHSEGSLQLELEQRQLLLFAACSLLLATKLRQTPRLYIETLIEFSKLELPIELSRGEILDGELLILSALKWDLAALVTPNEFLQELLARKCQPVLLIFMTNHVSNGVILNRNHNHHHNHSNGNQIETMKEHCLCVQEQHELADRVERHTQTLLELCLMDSKLSQYPSSVLAMSSMAVAINGLCKTNNNNDGANGNVALRKIVAQINETTNQVNELKLMIDVAEQIEKYVEILLQKTTIRQTSS